MIVSEVMATSGLPYLFLVFAGYMYSAIGYWGQKNVVACSVRLPSTFFSESKRSEVFRKKEINMPELRLDFWVSTNGKVIIDGNDQMILALVDTCND